MFKACFIHYFMEKIVYDTYIFIKLVLRIEKRIRLWYMDINYCWSADTGHFIQFKKMILQRDQQI